MREQSTPVYDHPSRGEFANNHKEQETWTQKSLYPYWEIPKNKLLLHRVKELRKAGNLSEVLFWKSFKDKNKLGFDIDRQVIIGNYIVDFFIPELGLVFEIDGSSHDDKIEYDAERDNYMESLNLLVIRIPDIDVKKNIEGVYKSILEIIKQRKNELTLANSEFPS
jgi:very-short-patch-repair endonuclease